MSTRTPTFIPQQVPSFAKPLLHAFFVVVGMTLLLGALWARAEDAPGPAAAAHAAR